MSDLNIEELLNSLENEDNEHLLDLNSSKIKSIKNDILQQLQLPREKLKDLHNRLEDYRYINDVSELSYGKHIRWISLKKCVGLRDMSEVKLHNPIIYCDIKITNSGIALVCKSHNNRRVFALNMNENLVFQKLTNQEKILLLAMDRLR